jgi:hypothetical protein
MEQNNRAMKHYKTRYPLWFTFVFLLTSLIVLLGCGKYELWIPEFTEFAPSPAEVTVEQLYSDYMVDEGAADAKYKGRRFIFTNVKVEEIESRFVNRRAIDIYIMNNFVKFRPRYPADIDGILVGFIVEIVGECQGLQWGRIIVKDCWVAIIEGDLGDVTSGY